MAPASGESSVQQIIDKISKNSVAEAKNLFTQNATDANTCDEHGMSLLQHACYKGNRDMVQFLLDQVSLPNQVFGILEELNVVVGEVIVWYVLREH